VIASITFKLSVNNMGTRKMEHQFNLGSLASCGNSPIPFVVSSGVIRRDAEPERTQTLRSPPARLHGPTPPVLSVTSLDYQDFSQFTRGTSLSTPFEFLLPAVAVSS
jgi:hypothetical protein